MSRRQRLRVATLAEIKQTARALLVRDGPSGVTLRAIGREMGMTAPALYRYYPSLEELLGALCADVYDDTTAHLERARDGCPSAHPGIRLLAVCREFRRWSMAHPAEFGLIFGSPLPALKTLKQTCPPPEAHLAGIRFAEVFGQLFIELWRTAPFPVPAEATMTPDLRAELAGYATVLGGELPLGAVQIFASSWIRLYGMVAMDVFGHLHFAFADAAPMFETELRDIAERVRIPPLSEAAGPERAGR